jgi:hypothetical protein
MRVWRRRALRRSRTAQRFVRRRTVLDGDDDRRESCRREGRLHLDRHRERVGGRLWGQESGVEVSLKCTPAPPRRRLHDFQRFGGKTPASPPGISGPGTACPPALTQSRRSSLLLLARASFPPLTRTKMNKIAVPDPPRVAAPLVARTPTRAPGPPPVRRAMPHAPPPLFRRPHAPPPSRAPPPALRRTRPPRVEEQMRFKKSLPVYTVLWSKRG